MSDNELTSELEKGTIFISNNLAPIFTKNRIKTIGEYFNDVYNNFIEKF